MRVEVAREFCRAKAGREKVWNHSMVSFGSHEVRNSPIGPFSRCDRGNTNVARQRTVYEQVDLPQALTNLGNLRQTSLVLGLLRLSQSFGNHLVLSVDDPPSSLTEVSDLLQSIRPHVSYAEDPDVLVLVQTRSDIFYHLLLVLHSLLLGLGEGHWREVDPWSGSSPPENWNC